MEQEYVTRSELEQAMERVEEALDDVVIGVADAVEELEEDVRDVAETSEIEQPPEPAPPAEGESETSEIGTPPIEENSIQRKRTGWSF